MDVAAAQEVFATRQRMDKAVIGRAHALKVRALVKLGELLKDLPKATGAAARGAGRHYPSLSIAGTISDISGRPSQHQTRSQTQRRASARLMLSA